MKLRKMNWRHPELKESDNETEFKVEKENEVLLGNESRGLGSCVAQLVERSLPTTEIHSLNKVIGNFTYN